MVIDLPTWLPPLVYMGDYDDDWAIYIDAVYNFFKKDFIDSAPVFRSRRIGLKRLPYFQGKESAFWHVTSEGSDEDERVPDLRRCERIRWPRPMIEHPDDSEIRCWSNERRGERRIVIWLYDQDYVVILADRHSYTLLWSAYHVDRQHTKDSLYKEYQAYQKKLTPPG